MRGRYQMEVRLAPVQHVKTSLAEGVARFGAAQALRAALYPISFSREARADGCRQKTLCYRAVLDPQGRISQ